MAIEGPESLHSDHPENKYFVAPRRLSIQSAATNAPAFAQMLTLVALQLSADRI
jgi:hypothetical protein